MSEDNDLEVRCAWYHASRQQRYEEVRRGSGLVGTVMYEKRGCYDCIGTKKMEGKCAEYIDLKKLNLELEDGR